MLFFNMKDTSCVLERVSVSYYYEAMFEFKGEEKGQLSYQTNDQLTLLSKAPQKNNISMGW